MRVLGGCLEPFVEQIYRALCNVDNFYCGFTIFCAATPWFCDAFFQHASMVDGPLGRRSCSGYTKSNLDWPQFHT